MLRHISVRVTMYGYGIVLQPRGKRGNTAGLASLPGPRTAAFCGSAPALLHHRMDNAVIRNATCKRARVITSVTVEG